MKEILYKRILAYTAFILSVLVVALVFTSWLLSAMMREGIVRSILTSEGVRWFFSSFVDNLASPFLVWLVLVSFAVNSVRGSGVLRCSPSTYRQRVALWLVAIEMVVFVVLMLLLTLVPHAILRSVTGVLCPGPFAQSLIPYTCFALCVMSVSFAWMSGKCHGLVDAFELLTGNVSFLPQLLLLYILVMQLVCSISFVFNVHFLP